MPRAVALWVLVIFFVVAGTNHFLNPSPYLAMMPPYLPWPADWLLLAALRKLPEGWASSFVKCDGSRVGA